MIFFVFFRIEMQYPIRSGMQDCNKLRNAKFRDVPTRDEIVQDVGMQDPSNAGMQNPERTWMKDPNECWNAR